MKKDIPYHLGIIIDGNRRWAKEKGLPTLEGHRRGYNNIKKIGEKAWEKGVKIITIYGFSTENWKRSEEEVGYLMNLLDLAFAKKNIDYYHKKGIRIITIGQKEKFSLKTQKKIAEAEKLTENNKNGILNLAISYGGRTEIIEAVKKIIANNIPNEKISEELINNNLYTKELPDPDLIIRSGGEQRLSNFLTWQSVYSELYFTKKYWPDFNEADLEEALKDYSLREKRHGK